MSWKSSAITQIVIARIKEFLREPEAVFWVCFFPIMMVIALGLAFRNKPVENINVMLVTSDPGFAADREILSKDSRIILKEYTAEEATLRLRTAKTDLLVRSHMQTSQPDGVQHEYHLDPTRPESILAKSTVDDLLQRAAGRQDLLDTKVSEHTEVGGRYIDFLVPGLLGMSLMGGGLWGIGFVTVDMRMRKLLKRFLATPMNKSEFLGGIMIARLAFLLPEVLILLIFSYFVFDVRMLGSWFELLLLIVLGAYTFSGLGLLLASRANTIEMVTGLMNLVMVPMWIFSGIFFSPEKYPDWMQPFIQALPLTSLNNLLRLVMQEGQTIWQHPLQLVNLFVWGTVSFMLGLKLFRWN
jgi:ABC-2 type transport system permease protein